jgi:electron transfer flavoprotein beta subunit
MPKRSTTGVGGRVVDIVVLVKEVPDSEALVQVKPDGSGVDVEDSYTLNFFDSLALEEALRIKEALGRGRVTALTVGHGPKPIDALRSAVAMGADDAVVVDDDILRGGDLYTTALVLAHAVKNMEYDLVLCGKEAFDDSSGAMGPMVAEFLGIPHITVVTKMEVTAEGDAVVVEREIEEGKEIIKGALPVLITAQKGLNEPRVPPITGVMKAMRAEIRRITVADVGLAADQVGEKGAKEEILGYRRPSKRAPVHQIEGDAVEAVRELVRLLREKAGII